MEGTDQQNNSQRNIFHRIWYPTEGDMKKAKINSQDYQELYELCQELKVWHELLTLGFVKVTNGYM
jgi:hypothetical protein